MASLRAWRRWRRDALLLTACVATALAIVTTFCILTAGSRQVQAGVLPRLPEVDPGAVDRLATALRFRTISSELEGGTEGARQQAARAFEGLGRHLESSFPRVHRELELEHIGAWSRLYYWQGSDPDLPPILLMAHMDVVPIESDADGTWTHPPFAGVTADGYVWGRGALDDKASLMGMLESVEHLLASGFVPRRSVYLAFGHDEEMGGADGAARIAQTLAERGVRLHFVLDEGGVMVDRESSGTRHPAALIGVAEKGYATLELSVELEHGGHSSIPPQQTAVGVIAEAVHRLEGTPMPAMLRSPTDEMIRTLGPEMESWTRRYALANLWLFEPILVSVMEAEPAASASLRTTQAATIIQGGTAENVLPTRASARVNFRIAPGDTIADVVEHVRDTVDDDRIQIRVLDGAREATEVSDPGSDAFERVSRTIRQSFPDTVVAPYLTVAGTDARYYEPLSDAVFRFLPIQFSYEDRLRVHGANERLEVEAYFGVVRFYMALIANA